MKKSGKTSPMVLLFVFILIVLIIAFVYLKYIENKDKVDPYAEKPQEVINPISTTVDGVPIPLGFYYVGGTKASGLVISDAKEDFEKGDNHEAAKTLVGNQFVWIPVENINEFKRKMTNSIDIPNVTTAILEVVEPKDGANIWEIVTEKVTDINTGVESLIISNAKTETTLNEAKAIYASVEKHGGFYVARYEAGMISPRTITQDVSTGAISYATLNTQDISFRAGTYPCNYISWSNSYDLTNEVGGIIELARNMYPTTNKNIGVVSTPVYGVQWDAMESFCNTSGRNRYGNYKDAEYSYIGRYLTDEDKNIYTTDSISSDKEKDKETLFTSGSSSYTRINNLYDIAGSLSEWTMEGMTVETDNMVSYARIVRGGNYKEKASGVSYRDSRIQNYVGNDVGFRIALYIK